MNQTAQPRYQPRGGYYGYPATYSYYPSRTYPYYGVPKKPIYPLVLVALGIILIIANFVMMPKLDPEIKKMAVLRPDERIAAVVFCNPCTGIDGEKVETGKIFVIDEARDVADLQNLPGVKQVRYVGRVGG